jgi:signal transduction histidine kinase
MAVAHGWEGRHARRSREGRRYRWRQGRRRGGRAARIRFVSHAMDWRSRWAGGRRIDASRRSTAAAGVLLGVLAVVEAVARAALIGLSAEVGVVLGVLALATALPLALLPPAGAAVAVTAACTISLAFFHTITVAGVAAELIALHRLGRTGARGPSAQLAVSALAAPFAVLALAGPRPTASEAAALTVVLAVLAPAAAWAGIARHAQTEALAHRAAQEAIAGALVEHTARGERARIARELHDIVAHHVSMIAVQAETARLTTPGLPEAGARQLSAIGDTARTALTEMRRLLVVLRSDAEDEPVDRRPQPDLSQLYDLVDQARAASVTGARLIVSGAPIRLDPTVELAAYRIAQEALTNARRHAAGAAVDVELHYTDGGLRLRIRDNGPGSPPTAGAGGHGMPGMRERAAAVGGRLQAGPAVGGGFLVEAALPRSAEAPPP